MTFASASALFMSLFKDARPFGFSEPETPQYEAASPCEAASMLPRRHNSMLPCTQTCRTILLPNE